MKRSYSVQACGEVMMQISLTPIDTLTVIQQIQNSWLHNGFEQRLHWPGWSRVFHLSLRFSTIRDKRDSSSIRLALRFSCLIFQIGQNAIW